MDRRTRRAVATGALGLLLCGPLGCRARTPEHAAPTAAAWPVVLGDGSPVVHALEWTGDTGVVAGEAPHGLTVAGRTLSDVAGGYLLGIGADGGPRWVRTLEGDSGAQVDALAATSEGGVVFAGHFEGHVRSGTRELRSAGARDCLVGRVDGQGRLQWLERWGTPGVDLCRAVVRTDGRVWVAGSRPDAHRPDASDVLLLQFDEATGERVGELALFGGGDDHGRSLAVDRRGQVALGGMYGGPFDLSGARIVPPSETALRWGESAVAGPASDYDAFVLVFASDGTVVGTGGWSSPGFDTVKDLVATDEGWIAAGVEQPRWTEGAGPGLASERVPLSGIVAGLSPDAAERWRYAESALVSASAVVAGDNAIWVVGHASGPLGDALQRGPRGQMAAVVLQLDRAGQLNRVARVCDGVAGDQGHAIATGPEAGVLWWAGSVSADADCLGGMGAQAGALFRLGAAPR